MKFYTKEETFIKICDLLLRQEWFSYVRFGDGELFTVDDPKFVYKRSHPKNEKLGLELRESLNIRNDNYLIGCACEGWSGSKNRSLEKIIFTHANWLFNEKVYSATMLHKLFLEDFDSFVKITKLFSDYKVTLVGGPTVCKSELVKKVFNVCKTIEFTDVDSYDLLDEKYDEIFNTVLDIRHTGPGLILSALGPTSCALAKRLWNHGLNTCTVFFDSGSVVDALAGVGTRSWIRNNQMYVDQKRKELE